MWLCRNCEIQNRDSTTNCELCDLPRSETSVQAALNETSPTHQDIAQVAFELWGKRGWRHGTEESDWLEAEEILKRRNDPRIR